ncbi:MAG TPA: RidA family protein [Candidatus Binatia bacterium]|nr:RidA family protein [Candidatus Binatia bacterium]
MNIERINPREWNCSAVVHDSVVYLSGIVADDKSLPMKGQTEQVLRKIDGVLAAAGTDKSRILSATVYLSNIDLKDEMNEAWMAWVDRKNLPARAAVGVDLTPGTLVEIMVSAAK